MLGIDVSKETLACTLVDSVTKDTTWRGAYPNTPKGISALLKRTHPQVPIILEPTGRYSIPVVRMAQAEGRNVLLAPPKRAKLYLASIQDRAKTDPLDSQGLALFALGQPPRTLKAYPLKSPVVEQVDQLLSARKGISAALTRLQMQRTELPHAASALDPAITALKGQKAVLDKEIDALCKSSPELASARRLKSVPGIGPIVAAAVAARLESKQFAHPDAFVAYVGLDIRVKQSGKRQGHAGLTRQGDAELRRLLFLAAQANLRCKDESNPLKRQYARERGKGLASTGALCAVARKIAKLCWSLHHHQTEYDPERVLTQGKQVPRQQQITNETTIH
jgi:transposase